jgi:hypothetical protein
MSRRVAEVAAAAAQPLPSPTTAAAAAAQVFANCAAPAGLPPAGSLLHQLRLPGASMDRGNSIERIFASPGLSTPGSLAAGAADLLLQPALRGAPGGGRPLLPSPGKALAGKRKGWPLGQQQRDAAGRNNFRPPGSPAVAGVPGLVIPPAFAVPGSAQPSPLVGALDAGAGAAGHITDLQPCEIDDLLMELDEAGALGL